MKKTEQWKKMMSEKMKGNTYGFKKSHKINQGRLLTDEIKLKKSIAIKQAYQEGRMSHMKEVWKESSKRWSKEKNPRWTGGDYFNKQKYEFIGGRRKHRVIAEQIIGRPLRRNEIIHHIDFDKLNNDPENLYYFENDYLHKKFHGLKNKPDLESNLKNII